MSPLSTKLLIFLTGTLFTALYCEFLIYYIVAVQCSWSTVANYNNHSPLKALILADTHLLGPRKGHWLDKWRREWQMHRAYQAIVSLHQPEVIFVLGDLFDEGEWSNDQQFEAYVDRFNSLFPVPVGSVMHVVAGNHDIGFHNFIRRGHAERFVKKLNSSIVQFVTLKENHFVLINSMAMEGDRCNMCTKARNDIVKYSGILKCGEDPAFCYDGIMKINYSRPILMQHFPLHRLSDQGCTEDGPPPHEKNKPFRIKIDALTIEATQFLATKLKPRVVFGGHTHHGCVQHHRYSDRTGSGIFEFDEHSVPSFSWRNRPNPKYMLVTFTPNDYSITKCSLPQESTILIAAALMVSMVIIQTLKHAS